jgi:hypothetical protein
MHPSCKPRFNPIEYEGKIYAVFGEVVSVDDFCENGRLTRVTLIVDADPSEKPDFDYDLVIRPYFHDNGPVKP